VEIAVFFVYSLRLGHPIHQTLQAVTSTCGGSECMQMDGALVTRNDYENTWKVVRGFFKKSHLNMYIVRQLTSYVST
jgi:hypothetical protein